MECLIDHIGLLNCTAVTPESGMYINSLPGINLGMIDKIADDEQITALGAWADIQLRASKRFQNDLIQKLAAKYKISALQQSIDLRRIIDAVNDQTAAAANYRGFQAEIAFDNNSNFIDSGFHSFYFQSISLYRKVATAALNAKIFDLDTGELLKTITIPLNTVAGWTRVNVNDRIFAHRIAVVYDSTLISSVSQDISNDRLNGGSNGCGCGCWECYDGCATLRIKGVNTDDLATAITDDEVTTGNNIFGLTAVFSVGCTYDALVCNNKDHFTDTWWYLLGNETMIERIFSPRKNVFTTIERNKGQELRDFYQVEYEKKLDTAVLGFELDGNDCCLTCNATHRIGEGTP